MRFNYAYVVLFFGAVAGLGALLFPTYFDVATIHRNSYLYSTALVILDDIDRRSDEPRVDLERARVLYLVGRYDDALDVLQDLTGRHPEHADAWRQLAATYRTVQRPVEAMTALEALQRAAPADSQALYQLDEYYRWLQYPERAADNLRRIIDRFPGDLASHERLVDLCLRMGDGEAAARLLQRMSETFPEADDALLDLGSLYLAQGDRRAVDVYQRLHGRHPERADVVDGLVAALTMAQRSQEALERFDAYYAARLPAGTYQERRARLRWVIGDYAGAASGFETAEAVDGDLDFSSELAELYAALGDFDDAADRAGRLTHRQPGVQANWRLLVAYLATAARRAELIATLEAYRRRWPDDETMLRELADAYQWVEDPASEARVLGRLLELLPEDADLLAQRAAAHRLAGDAAAAVSDYQSLSRRDPPPWPGERVDGLLDAATALSGPRRPCDLLHTLAGEVNASRVDAALRLAELLRHCGRPQSAAALIDRVASRHDDDAGVLAQLGQQLAAGGDVARAETRLQRALDLDPTQPLALSALAALRIDDDPQLAAALLRRLQDQRPRDGDVAYRLGLAWEAAGDSLRMVRAFEHALRWLPEGFDSEHGARRLGHALARTGQPGPALQVLEEGAERFPHDLEIANDAAELLLRQGRATEALRWLARVPRL